MINGRIAACECVSVIYVLLVPDEQNTYAALIKKIIFLLSMRVILLCFHHHTSVPHHTVSSFFRSVFFLCPFVTCCQLFNISKHMMSNKNFPLSYKYTFDHPFLYNKKQTIVSHMNKQKNEWAMERFTSSYLILYFASKYLLSFKKSSIVHEWVERNVSFFMMVYGDKHLNRCSNTMKTSRFVPSIKCNCITHTWYIYDIIHVE